MTFRPFRDLAEVAEALRTPIGLDAPAEATEDYEAEMAKDVKISRLEGQIRKLRSKIAVAHSTENEKFESGVKHGRAVERKEIAERLDRNASALVGNGTTSDALVRRVLRTLAQQLRNLSDEQERTG